MTVTRAAENDWIYNSSYLKSERSAYEIFCKLNS